MKENPWRRSHGGEIMEEKSWRSNPGGHPEAEAPRSHPGGTQEVPRRYPAGPQDAPRSTQRHPKGTQRHPGARQETTEVCEVKSIKTIEFYSKNNVSNHFRVDGSDVTLTKSAA